MSRVLTPVKTKEELKKAEIEKDRKRAESLMQAYAELQEEKKEIADAITERVKDFKREYDGTVKTITDEYTERSTKIEESLTGAEDEMKEIGKRQRNTLFDTKGNWRFESGWYMHVQSKTVVVTSETFSITKFIKKWGAYVDIKFKIADLLKLFMDAKQRAKINKYGFDLDTKEEFEFKKKAVKEEE